MHCGRGCRPAGVQTGGGGIDHRRCEKNCSWEMVREGGRDGDARERVGGPIPLHRERGRKRGRCGRGRRGVDVVGLRQEETSLAVLQYIFEHYFFRVCGEVTHGFQLAWMEREVGCE